MFATQWTENELQEVESCPQEQASIKFDDIILKDVSQVLTPTQVSCFVLDVKMCHIILFDF